jgi:hypothetical protein
MAVSGTRLSTASRTGPELVDNRQMSEVHHRVGAAGERGGERPRQPGDQAPRPVGAEHAGQQAEVAPDDSPPTSSRSRHGRPTHRRDLLGRDDEALAAGGDGALNRTV